MDVKAAVAFGAGEPLTVETVQLEGPKAGEVLVEIKCLSRKTNLCTAIRSTQGQGLMSDGTSRLR